MHSTARRVSKLLQFSNCRVISAVPRGPGSNPRPNKSWQAVLGLTLAGGTIVFLNNDKNKTENGPKIYSLKEFGQMVEKGRIVVAYQGSLYDMTDFTGHPGGVGRLQMAAGNDLSVYWQVYTQHNRGHIQEHMKPYKIG